MMVVQSSGAVESAIDKYATQCRVGNTEEFGTRCAYPMVTHGKRSRRWLSNLKNPPADSFI